MNTQTISVIVPIYNTAVLLPRCIDSILAQSYEDLEILLINDGSTDESGKVCDAYAAKDARVRVLHKENGGLSSARNAGLSMASGDYIAFVDSDDYISPGIYEGLLSLLGSDTDAIANAMYVRVDENGKETPSAVPHTKTETFPKEQFVRELLLHTGDVSVCTKLFPRALLSGVRFPEGKLNEDLLFILSVTECVREIRFLGEVGYYYFTRSGSISSGYGRAVIQMVENSHVTLSYIEEHYPSMGKEAWRFALYQHMAYLLLVPPCDATRDNAIYTGAVKFLRKNLFRIPGNPYFTAKQKLLLFFTACLPRTAASLYQRKKTRKRTIQ